MHLVTFSFILNIILAICFITCLRMLYNGREKKVKPVVTSNDKIEKAKKLINSAKLDELSQDAINIMFNFYYRKLIEIDRLNYPLELIT